MTKYTITFEKTEIYHYEIEIEAQSEDHANDLAEKKRDELCKIGGIDWDCVSGDMKIEDVSESELVI